MSTSPILEYAFNPAPTETPWVDSAGWDDFNSYSTGSITTVNAGLDEGDFVIGTGSFVLTTPASAPMAAWDDFDSYTVGSISSLTGNTDNNGVALGTGTFEIAGEHIGGESFDGYMDGAITVFIAGDTQAGDTTIDAGAHLVVAA